MTVIQRYGDVVAHRRGARVGRWVRQGTTIVVIDPEFERAPEPEWGFELPKKTPPRPPASTAARTPSHAVDKRLGTPPTFPGAPKRETPEGLTKSGRPVATASEVANLLHKERALSHFANRIHGLRGTGPGLRGLKGQTVQVAQATIRSKGQTQTIFVAGANSSAPFSQAQLAEIERLGMVAAPSTTAVTRGGDLPHAEQNIAAFIRSVGAKAIRWSRAVVGAKGSYICAGCLNLIKLMGGYIEPR